MKDKINEIEDWIHGLDKPVLSLERKEVMKNRIMHKISSTSQSESFKQERGVSRLIKDVARDVWLTDYQRVCMKERIISYIETAKQNRFSFSSALGLTKRFVGAFLAFAMFMGLFNFAGGSLNVASADSFTVIEDMRGEVYVDRDGDQYMAYGEMKLEEGDRVYTGEDGWVSIKFLDDSVARLKEGSEISLSKLFEDSGGTVVTNVEVEIAHGDMWTRVFNLFEDGDSFVVKAGDVQATAKKAAFNVHRDDDQSVIEVYSNVVEMKTSNEGSEVVKVKKGQKAEVSSQDNDFVLAESSEVGDKWVQENLENDKVHIAKIDAEASEELKDSIGSLPESGLYPFKSIKTGVVRLLTFDDISKQKLDFEVSQRHFVEWGVMMNEGGVDQGEAEGVFDQYVSEVESLRAMIENVRINGDDEYANELKVYLDSEIKKTKKYLKSILPTSPLYTAKEYMNVAEQASAETDSEMALIKSRQAASKLSEFQDLSEVGEDELAQEAMDDYYAATEDVGDAVEDVADDVEVDEKFAAVEEAASDMMEAINDEVAAGEIDVAVDTVSTGVAAPVQQTSDYGVPVTGSGDDMKILDPLLDLTR
ncbi:hypothetical protein HOG17_01880 [Candidatus Peregrinibacteria bacterium]|jgi:hypothetical protein|nr:hypothetical protein [Candidatus Peregrinibacteria bacterium]MBT4148108.1 hypothetical protein [Candidatus Peregrinibacteria bacterium]MBT4366356.1 hypothetical protein [Candidatus Peregrinibacteria bacterium]MBT4456438.1 hypothetical protein [Candidatus Peregrinibacteria bacterium]